MVEMICVLHARVLNEDIVFSLQSAKNTLNHYAWIFRNPGFFDAHEGGL